MMRLLFALLLSTMFSSMACAQSIYVLSPVGENESSDILGGNSALKASNFYDFIKNNWKVPTVEPINKDGVISNLEELIPSDVIVVPELVTVHTSQKRGGAYDYQRQRTSTINPLEVTVNPSEDSVFIYAFNKDGKLIYPLVPIPSGDGTAYTSIYRIQAFQEHSNFKSFFQPLVSNTDIDINGTYSKDQPNMNPPNALTFRGRIAGKYSLTLAVQLDSIFIPNSTPVNVKALASKIVTRTVEVNVVDGPETIDQLLFNSAKDLSEPGLSKSFGFKMKENDILEVSLSGRQFRKEWDGKEYRDNGSMNVMLKKASWNYSNTEQKPEAPYDADLIFIRKLTADGSSVLIMSNKLPPGATEGEGKMTIDAHGRRFNINVRVVK